MQKMDTMVVLDQHLSALALVSVKKHRLFSACAEITNNQVKSNYLRTIREYDDVVRMISAFWIGSMKWELMSAQLTTVALSIQVDGLGANYSSTEAKKEMIVLGGL